MNELGGRATIVPHSVQGMIYCLKHCMLQSRTLTLPSRIFFLNLRCRHDDSANTDQQSRASSVEALTVPLSLALEAKLKRIFSSASDWPTDSCSHGSRPWQEVRHSRPFPSQTLEPWPFRSRATILT